MALHPAVSVVAWLIVGGAAAASLVTQVDVKKRLDALEASSSAASHDPAAAPAASAPTPELATLRTKLEESEARQERLVADVRKDVAKVWEELLQSPDGSGAVAKQPGFEDAVRGVVERYAMEKKFRDAVQKATAPLVPKKPSFVQLATALKLRPEQAERFAGDIRDIQQELYQILSIPRADGVAPLEEIQQAEQYPEGNPKRSEAFLKLFKLTIPDTQETYVERAILLATRVKNATKTYFDPDQQTTLDGLDLDWFGIRMQ